MRASAEVVGPAYSPEFDLACGCKGLAVALSGASHGSSEVAARACGAGSARGWPVGRKVRSVWDVLVDVVVPSFNHAEFVGECLESVFSQTAGTFSLVVVDDGSTDGSPGVIRDVLGRHPETEVEFIEQRNSGLCRVLNDRLTAGGGKYFCMLGSDDVWLPTKLERQIELMEDRPEVAACFADSWVIDDQGRRLYRSSSRYPYRGGRIFEDLLLMRFCPSSPTSLFRRDVLMEVGGFNEARSILEDQDMWLRVTRRHEVAYLPEPLASWRVHGRNTSTVRVAELLRDERASVEGLLREDPELEVFRRRIEARLLAREAAVDYNHLDLRAARAKAMKALRASPADELARRIALRSVIGRKPLGLLRKMSGAARRCRASRGDSEARVYRRS